MIQVIQAIQMVQKMIRERLIKISKMGYLKKILIHKKPNNINQDVNSNQTEISEKNDNYNKLDIEKISSLENNNEKDSKNKLNGNKKSTFKKVKNIIEYIIIFLIILVNATLIIKSINNPNKSPDLFGKKAFIIISGSMVPTIQVGDIVIIEDRNDIKLQDIIAYRRDSKVIVHRVVEEHLINGEKMYVTKGDFNQTNDLPPMVSIDEVEGIYICKIPFIGKIFMFLYNNLAIVVVIIVLILLIKYFW